MNLVDRFVPGDVKEIIVGPANDRPGAVKLGNNQSITQEEAEAFQAIQAAGYKGEIPIVARSFHRVLGWFQIKIWFLRLTVLSVR